MRRLWVTLGVVVVFGFAVLGWIGTRIYQATIYLAGGIIGTNHHLYFSGTPTAALAWGASRSRSTTCRG